MRRAGYLFDDIFSLENLYLAFYKAAKGKSRKKKVLSFQKNLSFNLLELKREVLDGNFSFGNYNYFTIYDPKVRKICAALFSERVLHHALMNICHDSFEKKQIYSSCACRKGKGTYFALNLARKACKKYKYFLKLDVRKYFDSIDQNILQLMLKKMFKDNKVISLFGNIIKTYEVSKGKGLPIGNLTSQYLANHYLCEADHFLKEELKVPYYIRYMDDIVLFSDSKQNLLTIGYNFENYLKENLKLQLKPFCLNYTNKGLPFLGYLLFPDKVKLAKRSKKRFVIKLKKYHDKLNDQIWTQKEYQIHTTPLISYTEFAKARGFRQKVLSKLDNNQGALTV